MGSLFDISEPNSISSSIGLDDDTIFEIPAEFYGGIVHYTNKTNKPMINGKDAIEVLEFLDFIGGEVADDDIGANIYELLGLETPSKLCFPDVITNPWKCNASGVTKRIINRLIRKSNLGCTNVPLIIGHLIDEGFILAEHLDMEQIAYLFRTPEASYPYDINSPITMTPDLLENIITSIIGGDMRGMDLASSLTNNLQQKSRQWVRLQSQIFTTDKVRVAQMCQNVKIHQQGLIDNIVHLSKYMRNIIGDSIQERSIRVEESDVRNRIDHVAGRVIDKLSYSIPREEHFMMDVMDVMEGRLGRCSDATKINVSSIDMSVDVNGIHRNIANNDFVRIFEMCSDNNITKDSTIAKMIGIAFNYRLLIRSDETNLIKDGFSQRDIECLIRANIDNIMRAIIDALTSDEESSDVCSW